MVSTVAGTDPAAKSPATCQSTLPFLEWIAVPAVFRHGGVKQVGSSHRRERMDAEKQYQQAASLENRHSHAGQTHDGADDKTGERIEPVHGRHRVHHWDMIPVLTAVLLCWTAVHCGRELRRGTVGRIPPRRISRNDPRIVRSAAAQSI